MISKLKSVFILYVSKFDVGQRARCLPAPGSSLKKSNQKKSRRYPIKITIILFQNVQELGKTRHSRMWRWDDSAAFLARYHLYITSAHFGPFLTHPLCQQLCSTERQQKLFLFLNPPTQSFCWRNIWMVPEGIVVLNISSFMGGTNFWGSAKDDNIFLPPSFDDGILEVSEISTNKKIRQNTKCSRRAGGSGVSPGGGGGGVMASTQNLEKRTETESFNLLLLAPLDFWTFRHLWHLFVNSVIWRIFVWHCWKILDSLKHSMFGLLGFLYLLNVNPGLNNEWILLKTDAS